MSQKELKRVRVVENAAEGRLSVGEASRLLQLSERQVQRLKRRYRPDSIDWVRHGNRGRPMPWAVSPPQKQWILTLARGKYQGFNDSHLAEKLREEENLALSRETVRRILRGAKLFSPQQRRPQPALRPSRRRRRFRFSPFVSPLRSGALPQLALSARGRRRSHRNFRRPVHRASTFAGRSRLCRRNRRALPSTRWPAARLSRRPASSGFGAAARRTRRAPSPASYLGAEKKKTDPAYLQSLRPPRFGGRYLIDRG